MRETKLIQIMSKQTKNDTLNSTLDNLDNTLVHSESSIEQGIDIYITKQMEELYKTNVYIHKDKSIEEFYEIVGNNYSLLKYSFRHLKEDKFFSVYSPDKSLTESQLIEISRPLHDASGEEIPMRPLLAHDLDNCLISADAYLNEEEIKKNKGNKKGLGGHMDFYIEGADRWGNKCNDFYRMYFRPHLEYFLKEVSKYYDLAVFTASTQEYADKICDRLEEHVELKGRLYRDHCSTTSGGQYTKDLSMFGRDNVFLLDDTVLNFLLNLNNGVYIHGWAHNDIWIDDDIELKRVTDRLVECGKTGVENIKKIMRIEEVLEHIKYWHN